MKPEKTRAKSAALRPQQTIGILGGLGPFAHLQFEKLLLETAQELVGACRDQNFPEWLLHSLPATPDRTAAILEGGEDPTPYLLRGLETLRAGGADFGVIVCNTAHFFLPCLRAAAELPLLDMITVAAEACDVAFRGGRVGILGTTGTVRSGLYHKALRRVGAEPVSLLDLPGGADKQLQLVMEPIYGPLVKGAYQGGGIKGEGPRECHAALVREAEATLRGEGGVAGVLICCTELSAVLPETEGAIDSLRTLARAAIRVAYGLESLPDL